MWTRILVRTRTWGSRRCSSPACCWVLSPFSQNVARTSLEVQLPAEEWKFGNEIGATKSFKICAIKVYHQFGDCEPKYYECYISYSTTISKIKPYSDCSAITTITMSIIVTRYSDKIVWMYQSSFYSHLVLHCYCYSCWKLWLFISQKLSTQLHNY